MTDTIRDLDALLDMAMDDIEDLPPVGVPPTGHYNLLVSATRVTPDEAGKNPYIKFAYEVTAVNEVKNPDEANLAAVGMTFTKNFSPVKRDGTVNDIGLKLLKKECAPYAAHFGTSSISSTVEALKTVEVAAAIVRKQDKRDADRWDVYLNDVTIL